MNKSSIDIVNEHILQNRLREELKGERESINGSLVLEFDGKVDKCSAEKAINDIISRHEILRTTYALKSGEVYASVLSGAVLHLREIQLPNFTAQGEEQINLIIKIEQSRCIDISSELPIQVSLINVEGTVIRPKSVLVVLLHNVVSDPASREIILKEFSLIYKAYSMGLHNPLKCLHTQYFEYVKAQHSQLHSCKLEIPTDYVSSLNKQSQLKQCDMTEVKYAVEIQVVDRLKTFAASNRVTTFMVLKCAFDILLHKMGMRGCNVGIPISTRRTTEANELIGAFEHVVPASNILEANSSLKETLDSVSDSLLTIFEYVNTAICHEPSQLNSPKNTHFDTILSYERWAGDIQELKDINGGLSDLSVCAIHKNSDLSVHIIESHHGILLDCSFNTEKYDDATIRSMLNSFDLMLSSICEDPESRLESAPFIDKDNWQYLIYDINNTEFDFPKGQCIQEFFEQKASETPSAIALICNGISMSYEELNAKSNQLAHYLLNERGVKPDTLVGVCMNRSLEVMISVLGILKAGAAYVPLDPSYPVERLAYMLEDSQLSIVLADETGNNVLVDSYRDEIVMIGNFSVDFDHFLSKYSVANINKQSIGLNSEHLAYVIYTSGSTGKPKGVMIEHKSVANFISSMSNTLSISSCDTVLAQTSINFDIHVLEFYMTLGAGAALVIASDEERKDPSKLVQLIAERDISLIQATPSLWKALFDYGWSSSTRMKLLCGGEALTEDLLKVFHDKCPISQIFNMYGPTETTVWSAMAQLDSSHSHLGRAIQNTQFYILDDSKRLLPRGAIGELYIGGEGLARGYFNRPTMTNERFIENPYYDESQVNSSLKLYKTGDLVRYSADDNLEFVGRTDDQVKIRGFRIELGEIESTLIAQPYIDSSLVMALLVAGSKQLIAYIKPTNGLSDDVVIERAKNALSEKLPDYMVPSIMLTIEEWPLTPNGKVDKRSLPHPEHHTLQSTYKEPSTVTEKELTKIWSVLLGITEEKIGSTTNFFNLGGHSLMVSQVLQKVEAAFNIEITLAELFDAVTIQKQAELIDLAVAESQLNQSFEGEDEVEVLEF